MILRHRSFCALTFMSRSRKPARLLPILVRPSIASGVMCVRKYRFVGLLCFFIIFIEPIVVLLQKKKLHVKSVIAKVTGQSEHLIANEAQPSDSATPRIQNAYVSLSEAQDRSRGRSSSFSTGPGTCEEEAGHQSVTTDFDTAHSDSDSDAQSSSGSVSKGKLSPCCRIDFELDSTVLEGISETIGIIRSHFCYWDNRSVASLIVALMHSPCPLSSDVEFGRLDLSAQ